jgi:hypothetical protein
MLQDENVERSISFLHNGKNVVLDLVPNRYALYILFIFYILEPIAGHNRSRVCTELKVFLVIYRNLISPRYKERYYLPDGETVLRKVC